MWPTPDVPNGGRRLDEGATTTGMTPNGKKQQVGLENAVRFWATPTATDYGSNQSPSEGAAVRPSLRGQATAQVGSDGSPPAVLSPQFVETLMGFAIGWTDFEPSATPLSRRLPPELSPSYLTESTT